MKYLGSSEGKCVNNFDNFGFVLAASSSVFGYGISQSTLGLLSQFRANQITGALIPNPFYDLKNVSTLPNEKILALADSGLQGFNLDLFAMVSQRLSSILKHDFS